LIAGPRGMLKMRGERKKIGHAFDAARRVYSVAAVYPMFASDEMTSSAGWLNVRQVHWPVRGGAEAVDDSCVALLCARARVCVRICK